MFEKNVRTKTLVGGIAALLAAFGFAGAVAYVTMIKPRLAFDPQTASVRYERDVLSGRIDAVAGDLFSTGNVERYREGDGFTATFRILHDPRVNYETSERLCGVEAWKTFAQTSNPARRQLIVQREIEFQKCVDEFEQELSIVRSVEIGVDDTNGVTSDLADFVRRNLAGVVESIVDVNKRDEVRLVLFRLSDIDAFEHRTYALRKNTSRADVEGIWAEGLEGWLLRERGPTRRTSLIRGLSNALSRNRSIRKRQVFLFSDGMENSPETASFYRILGAGMPLDGGVLESEQYPDLRAAEVKWYFPPLRIPNYKKVRDYWERVLKDRCNSPNVEIIY